MTDYKTVFTLAQDKGYKRYFSGILLKEMDSPLWGYSDKQSIFELTLIQKWLRDEHNFHVEPFWWWVNGENKYEVKLCHLSDGYHSNKGKFGTYESALLAGVYEALKLLP